MHTETKYRVVGVLYLTVLSFKLIETKQSGIHVLLLAVQLN